MDEETKKRIAEIRAREQVSSRAPWESVADLVMSKKGGYIASGCFPEDASFIAHARQDVPFLLDTLEKAEKDQEQIERRVLRDVLARIGCGRDPYLSEAYDTERLVRSIVGHAEGLKDRADDLDKKLDNITRSICDYVCDTAGEAALRRYVEERRVRERKA